MISTYNLAKCLRHKIFDSKKLELVCGSELVYMHQYKRFIFNTRIPVEVKQNLQNTVKYYTPVIRSHSTKSDQGNVNELVVRHDPVGKEFYIEIVGVGIARVEYERQDRLMILKHTDVPSELGGRGIGKVLAKEALEYAAKNDLQLEIKCPFIYNYVYKYEPKYIKYIKE